MLELAKVKLPLVAIMRGITPAEAPAIADVLLEGGIEVAEVTMNSPDPLDTLRILVDRCHEKMLVGAGTVLTLDHVDQVADTGGGLIVSPNMNPEVIARTKEKGMVSAPGCLSATEMFNALDAGADVLKAFPGNIITPAVVKAYKAVLPEGAKIVVTGGVDETTIPAYRDVGVFGLGLGSNLYNAGKSAEQVSQDLAKYVAAFHS